MNSAAELDVIIYGATGYTGRLVAEYFSRTYGERSDVKWALAGHSIGRLEQVRSDIGAPATLPLISADAFDGPALRAMAGRTKAVISTVGPYLRYGSELVAACVEQGTDYLDLCGEPILIRKMIDEHEDHARKTGARILFSCGFDSIPFELGVWFLQNEASKRFGSPLRDVKGRVRKLDGGFSAGTLASIRLNIEAGADHETANLLNSAFALVPDFPGAAQPNVDIVEYDSDLGSWVSPFVMAAINIKNVHRSNALQDFPYGTGFSYDERLMTGGGEQGKQGALDVVASFSQFRAADLPPSGSGPTREEREQGSYELLFLGRHSDGELLQAIVSGDQDPGYGSTSKMLSESALCLIQEATDVPGGIWTPGAAMQSRLLERLSDRAGLSFRLEIS